jgi:hypothetical protein
MFCFGEGEIVGLVIGDAKETVRLVYVHFLCVNMMSSMLRICTFPFRVKSKLHYDYLSTLILRQATKESVCSLLFMGKARRAAPW